MKLKNKVMVLWVLNIIYLYNIIEIIPLIIIFILKNLALILFILE